jgi:hypothetical protein
VPYRHQVRDGDGRDQPDDRAGGEQHGVEGDRDLEPDPVPADGQRTAADGQQRHRQATVERSRGGIEQVGARLVAMVRPVQRASAEQHHQQDQREGPDARAQGPPARQVQRQRGACRADDRGAHHGGVPVGTEVANRRGTRPAGCGK